MKQWVKILLACLLVIVVIAGVGFYMLKYHRQTVKTMAKQLLDEVPAENASKATNPPEEIRASSAQALIEAWDGSFDDAANADPDSPFEVLGLDTVRLQDRFALPDLARMEEGERASLVESTQVLKRMKALGVDPESLQTPEVEWKRIHAYVTGFLRDNVLQKPRTETFDGDSVSALNRFLAGLNGEQALVVVDSPELAMDETLSLPSGAFVNAAGTRLVPGDENLLRAVLLDGVQDCGLSGLVIEGGCDYGIYIKNSGRFAICDNDISGARYKGIVMMGSGDRFEINDNYVHENNNGGIFLNGGMSFGVLDGNRVIDNSGARNLTAGIVLCSMEIEDIDTAYNEFKDVRLFDITESPNHMVLYGNTVARNHSSGIYSDAGYLNYVVNNDVVKNEKEGMCFDYGSFGNFISRNNVQSNGGRNRMSDDDLKADFVLELGRLADGSSPAKLPGISLDNTAYNTLYANVVCMNYGSGIKAVRSAYRNLLLCNQVSDNNLGASEAFHFFGIELSADMNADEQVVGLNFTPCYENIVARNVVSGGHYAGVFLGKDSYINDFFDNLFMGCTNWSMESISGKFNSSVNNMSNVSSRGISLTSAMLAVPVAGRAD